MADKTSLCFYLVLAVSSVLLQVSQCSLYSSRTVYQRIYEEVGDIKASFRLLNATSQIGCSATPSNVSGVLWYIESQDNITYLLDNHQHAPYIVIMEPHLFTSDNVHRLMDSSHVNGVIMYYNMSGTIPPELS